MDPVKAPPPAVEERVFPVSVTSVYQPAPAALAKTPPEANLVRKARLQALALMACSAAVTTGLIYALVVGIRALL